MSQPQSDRLHLPPISAIDGFFPSHHVWTADEYKKNTRPSSLATSEINTHCALPPLMLPSTSTSLGDSVHHQDQIQDDFDEILKSCHYICKSMMEHKAHLVKKEHSAMRPWLDDMVATANQVLSAFLRLRKQHMPAEFDSPIPKTTLHPSPLLQYASPFTAAPPPASVFRDDTATQIIPSSTILTPLGEDSETLRPFQSRPSSRKRRKSATFQGRCHSCNISETPEWRRGPDGARTLCNACGLHYAKLMRKRMTTPMTKQGITLSHPSSTTFGDMGQRPKKYRHFRSSSSSSSASSKS